MSKSKGANTRFINDRLGALPSPWDERHYRVAPVSAEIASTFPIEEISLLSFIPDSPWPDQGNIGTLPDGNITGRGSLEMCPLM